MNYDKEILSLDYLHVATLGYKKEINSNGTRSGMLQVVHVYERIVLGRFQFGIFYNKIILQCDFGGFRNLMGYLFYYLMLNKTFI